MQWYTIRAEGNSLFFLMEKRPSCTRSSGHLVEGLQLNGDSVGLTGVLVSNGASCRGASAILCESCILAEERAERHKLPLGDSMAAGM